MTRCDECGDVYGERADHDCPIYYTYPGLTVSVVNYELDRAVTLLRQLGYNVISSMKPPDRCSIIIEVAYDPRRAGEPERHDRRTEVKR